EAAALEAFGQIIRGHKTLQSSLRRKLRSLASTVHYANPFPASWDAGNPLRSEIADSLSSLAHGKDPAYWLLRLHLGVTRNVRRIEPWLLHLSDRPVEFQKWRPGTGVPDFRFTNLRKLLRQTRWRSHAV